MRRVEERWPVLHFIRACSSKTHRGESETIYHKEKHNGWKHHQQKSLFILAGRTLWDINVCVCVCIHMAGVACTSNISTFAFAIIPMSSCGSVLIKILLLPSPRRLCFFRRRLSVRIIFPRGNMGNPHLPNVKKIDFYSPAISKTDVEYPYLPSCQVCEDRIWQFVKVPKV